MAIGITGLFKPRGSYPLVEDIDLLGGFRVVNTIADRDAIPTLDRKFGMLAYVLEDNKLYQLLDQGNGDVSDNSNWVESALGGASTASNNGYTITFTQSDLTGGYLIVNHNLNLKNNIGHVTIRSNTNNIFYPDDIEYTNANTLKVDFRSIEPLDGTWSILITGVSESTNIQTPQHEAVFNDPVFNETTFG